MSIPRPDLPPSMLIVGVWDDEPDTEPLQVVRFVPYTEPDDDGVTWCDDGVVTW